MNATFKSLVESVTLLVGKRNSLELISTLISDVTLEEHGARNYLRDFRTMQWVVTDEEPLNGESVPSKLNDTLNVGEIKSLSIWTSNANWVSGINEYITDPRLLIPNTPLASGIHVMKSGDVYRIRSTEPMLIVEYEQMSVPNVTPEGYSSWIAEGVHRSVIVYEAASRLQNIIGDSSYRDTSKHAHRARVILRTEPHRLTEYR